MADWVTISSLGTAGGTLVLAFATFASVRSANRTAAIAEHSLQVNLRPVLVPSRPEDPREKVMFVDTKVLVVRGGTAVVERTDEGVIYAAMPLRNVGAGIAVLHGWHLTPGRRMAADGIAELDEFRMLQRDLYTPAGETGYWQMAIRTADDALRPGVERALDAGDALTIDLLYGDHEGGQRAVTRFVITPREDSEWLCAVTRHWRLDGTDPRGR